MENWIARLGVRRVPVILSVILLAGALTGVLSCRLAASGRRVDVQAPQPGEELVPRKDLLESGVEDTLHSVVTLTFTSVATTYLPLVSRASGVDKWALWTGPTQLRGANVYQRCVYPELDGPDFFLDLAPSVHPIPRRISTAWPRRVPTM